MAEDPNIRVLKITPDDPEFWDSRPEIGDNPKVAM